MPDFTLRLPTFATLLDDKRLHLLFRECQPKILVVTDGLNYDAAQGFGLTQFVASLEAGLIHGMHPKVVKASRAAGTAGADITGFRFDDAGQGLVISRYDVCFLFGVWSEGVSTLPAAEVDVIARFMQGGGGVFATGDHETLGASLCSAIPRVRRMRKWVSADSPPNVSNATRHSTNLSGDDETEEFADQSDRHPQRLYLNFRTGLFVLPGVDRPAHPVVQLKTRPGAVRSVLEVYPDHPHEGECVLPTNAAETFTLAGAALPEWPKMAVIPLRPLPQMVASAVSHGDGFPGGNKLSLAPKLFGAIAAYDGHLAAVGRVVTDSTWHHFININLDGTGTALIGLQSAPGTDSDALTRLREYFVNLATWLMPKKTRLCLRNFQVLRELARFPLAEELLTGPRKLGPNEAVGAGAQLMAALGAQQPPWVAEQWAQDVLLAAVGEAAYARLAGGAAEEAGKADDVAAGDERLLAQLGRAALGGMLAGLITELTELGEKGLERLDPHASFGKLGVEAARLMVAQTLAQYRKQLDGVEKAMAAAR